MYICFYCKIKIILKIRKVNNIKKNNKQINLHREGEMSILYLNRVEIMI